MGVCVTTIPRTLEAVGALGRGLSASDELIKSDLDAIVTALRELGSGLLAVEHPEHLDGVVQALLPAFCFRELAVRCDFEHVLSEQVAHNALAFFAARAATLMTSPPQSPYGAQDEDDADLSGPTILLGVLGQAVSLLKTVDVLLTSAIPRHVRLADNVVADIVFAAVRLQESCVPVSQDNKLQMVHETVYSDGRCVAAHALEHVLGVCKTAKATGSMVARVWNAGNRAGLHTLLVDLLKAEDKVHDFERKQALLSLAPCSVVLRQLVTVVVDEDDMNAILSSVLAIALPLAGDVNLRRRLDASAVISHCLRIGSREQLRFHSQAMLSAMTQSLLWDDCLSTAESFPTIAELMSLVDQTSCLSEDPPKVWNDALQECLRNFVAHIDHRGDSGGESDQAKIDQHLSTAASVAEWIPVMAKARIIPHLETVMVAMQMILCRAARLVGEEGGASSLHVYISAKNAFVETIRVAWPRAPAHFDAVFQGTSVAVLHVRTCKDPEVREAVMAGALDVLVWASRCGQRPKFRLLLDAAKDIGRKYPSLAPIAELCRRVECVLAEDKTAPKASSDCGHGAIVDKFFASSDL
jgi:hypothetical protein